MRLKALRAREFALVFVILAFVTALPSSVAASEPLVGKWRAIDKSNGEVQSIIELFVKDGNLHGRIVDILSRDGEKLDPICTRCQGELKDAKVVGAIFISGLKKDGNRWIDGKVVDLRPGPTQGITANCELELVDGRVKLSGYLWLRFMSGTDYWQRVPVEASPQPKK